MLPLLLAVTIAAGSPEPGGSAAPETAVIYKNASTNTGALTIAVPREGPATVHTGTAIATVPLASDLVQRFYADLEGAGELASLPVAHCMKSASFGTTTTIGFRGAMTPDLECAANAAARALGADARAIVEAVGSVVAPARRHTQPIMRRPPPATTPD